MKKITIEVSVGEAIDKLSILLIKSDKIVSKSKLHHIYKEIDVIQKELSGILIKDSLLEMKEINLQMWDVNERRKELIGEGIFDEEYLELSKQESILNDERFRIKQRINIQFQSFIQDQKSYDWASTK